MKLLREYVLALIGFSVTLALTVIANFVLNLTKEGTFLTFVIGASVTLTITLLEHELKSDLDQRISRTLEIYNLLYEIEDPELSALGFEAMEKLRTELRNLKRGVINQTGESESQDRLATAKYAIRTVEVATDTFLSWKMDTLPSREINWYKSVVDAIERGCKVEQMIIVEEAKFDLSAKSFKDLGPLEDNRAQKFIVKREEATSRGGTQLLYNFTIIDDREVLYQRTVPGSTYDTIIDKSQSGVRYFIRKYATLKKISRRIPRDQADH